MLPIRRFLLRMGSGRFYSAKILPLLIGLMVFSVASPALARLGVEYQMALGNPDGASTDTNSRTKFLINQRAQYAISFNDDTHQPNWVSWSYSFSDDGTQSRTDYWREEELLPSGYLKIGISAFGTNYGVGYDRGHMCPSADRTKDLTNNQVTFRMSNIIPQASQNNQGLWRNFEDYCRTMATTNSADNEILIITGPANFSGLFLSNGMAIPQKVWKIAVVVSNASSPTPVNQRINANCRVMAIITPNVNTNLNSWSNYLTSVKEVEAITGFNFFSNVDPALATYLKRIKDTGTGPNQPTVITGFSPFSGSAGTAVTITGYNFGSTPTIKFNGVSASATVSGGTNIIATVPAGAGTGPITVATSSGGTDNSTNNFTVTASSSPSLSLSVTTLSAFSTTWPSVSASQSYLLTGASLTGNITVTAPTNFELSLNNTNFASSQSLSPISGNLSNTVYVRLSASVLAGSASGVIAHSGGGAISQNLAISGNIDKATPTVSWSNPLSIVYGTVLSGSQLNATSSVVGSFTYSPSNGTLLNAGTNPLSAIFRANDTNNYISPITNTVSLVIAKGTPSISSIPTASAIMFGQALSNSVLSGGSASVPGSFAFTAPATLPSTTGLQGVIFTPTDSGNYNTVETSVMVTVNSSVVTLALSPSTLGVFSTTTGTASTSQSYRLSGSGLTGDLSVTAPAGFEISLTNGAGYVSSLSLAPAGGSLTVNPIYVRIAATNSAGVLNGSLIHNGGRITNQSIPVYGVVFATNANSPVTLAKWTFESSTISGSGTSSANYTPEQGLQTNTAWASSVHAVSSTYSSPSGNGSARSFSCNNWTTNDYFQFALSSLGHRNLILRFDHTGSGTGPLEFRIEASTDGVAFNAISDYDIPRTNSATNNVWGSGAYVSNSTLSFDLSSMSQLANKTNLIFRLVQRGTTSINNGTVAGTGTSRVDNFEVTATALDTNPPVLVLAGGETTSLVVGGSWSDPGVTALDAEDGSLTANVSGALNPQVLGSYLLTYTATDLSGNSSSTNRIVNVVLNNLNSVTSDSDGNGLPDLVEYALGGAATGNESSILPSPQLAGTNLRISFLARTNDSNLIIRPVISTNLTDSNSWSTNGVVKTGGVATNNGFEMQTWETPVGSAVRKFLKINISR